MFDMLINYHKMPYILFLVVNFSYDDKYFLMM